MAICAIFILPDFPETSTGWLTSTEQLLARQRMAEDAGVGDTEETEPKEGRLNGLSLAVKDGKVWWLAVALTSIVTSLSFNA